MIRYWLLSLLVLLSTVAQAQTTSTKVGEFDRSSQRKTSLLDMSRVLTTYVYRDSASKIMSQFEATRGDENVEFVITLPQDLLALLDDESVDAKKPKPSPPPPPIPVAPPIPIPGPVPPGPSPFMPPPPDSLEVYRVGAEVFRTQLELKRMTGELTLEGYQNGLGQYRYHIDLYKKAMELTSTGRK